MKSGVKRRILARFGDVYLRRFLARNGAVSLLEIDETKKRWRAVCSSEWFQSTAGSGNLSQTLSGLGCCPYGAHDVWAVVVLRGAAFPGLVFPATPTGSLRRSRALSQNSVFGLVRQRLGTIPRLRGLRALHPLCCRAHRRSAAARCWARRGHDAGAARTSTARRRAGRFFRSSCLGPDVMNVALSTEPDSLTRTRISTSTGPCMLCDAAGEMLGMTRLAMSPGALSERAGAALAESLDCAAAGSVLGAGCGAAGDLVCVAVEWSELCVASDGAAGAADGACAGAGCGDVEAVELAAWEEFVASWPALWTQRMHARAAPAPMRFAPREATSR